MKTSSITFAFITIFATVNAAPVDNAAIGKRELNLGGLPGAGLLGNSPVNGVLAAGQDATAEVFKLGDAVLNTPIDAATKLMSGDPVGAVTGLASDAMKLAGGLPGDLMGMMRDLMGGAPKAAKT